MDSCETKLLVSSAVNCCAGDIEGEYKGHVVVDVLVCNAQHVKYLDEYTFISVYFNQGIVISRAPMEIWVGTENITVRCPINHR